MKHPLVIVRGLCSLLALWVLAAPTHAAIVVGSNADTVANTVRTQVSITENTAFDRNGRGIAPAISVIRISASLLIRDSLEVSNGLQVKKTVFQDNFTAWGEGDPLTRGPANTDEPPFQGLTWPYRDRYDFSQFNQQFDPPADDVGSPFDSQPGVYGFVNINAWSRGGPQDTELAGQDLGYLHRGITGMGEDVDSPASYFLFDIIPLIGDPGRELTLKIFAASAVVVTTFNGGQSYELLSVPIDDFETTIRLPEPAGLALLTVAGTLLIRRRR